jgi:predicted O-linked N-acetylglucosamine transferase (SPINDLY family)
MNRAPQAMERAIAAYSRGRWAEAETLARSVLDAEANHFEALSLLGVIAAQTHRAHDAAEFFGRAVAANPADAAACCNHGSILQSLGRLDEALASYDRALALKPNLPEAHSNRANVLTGLGRPADALPSCDRAIALKPDLAEAWNNRGNALHELERHDEALASYDRALRLRSDYAEAHYNRGTVLRGLKRQDEALASYDRALQVKPDYAEAHYNRGCTLLDVGRPDDALASFDRALAINPNHADACNNRGYALKELGRFDEALASYDNALRIRPDLGEAHYNRANALKERQRLEEALEAYDRSLAIQPGRAAAWFNRGITLFALRRGVEALASFDRALAIEPDSADACNNRGYVLLRLRRFADAAQCYARLLEIAPEFEFAKGNLAHAKMLCCDWADLEPLRLSIAQDVAARKPVTAPFGYQGICESEPELRICAEVYAAARYPAQPIAETAPRARAGAKIRVGYVSGEFRHQATSFLMAELFELHARDRFEIVAFDNGWDDGSEVRHRINDAFDEIVDISRMEDREAATAVRSREIDVLVNLNGYFGDERQGVFAHRPSPVQVNYLGFPGTLGADYIDYLIADATVIPESSRRHYSEKIAYLPDSYQVNDRKRAIAERTFSREELGLPKSGFVFCCFNNNYKITPTTFDAWMRILGRVPGSVLWLLRDDPVAVRNLREEARIRGVDPERLVFAPRLSVPEHLARHRSADLFVDSLPYNAHTTASDALWAGLPLLTLIGTTFPGRVAASLLRAMDLPELIATTQEQYETLAVELATEPQRLARIRGKLDRNRSIAPLFDTPRFARNLEDLYVQMIERYRAGLPPECIRVAS